MGGRQSLRYRSEDRSPQGHELGATLSGLLVGEVNPVAPFHELPELLDPLRGQTQPWLDPGQALASSKLDRRASVMPVHVRILS